MTRQLPHDSVADVIADGLTEDEIAARFEIWLSDLESIPAVDLWSARPTSCVTPMPTATCRARRQPAVSRGRAKCG